MKSVNPYTQEVMQEFATYSAEKVNELVGQARTAYDSWRTTSFTERATLMRAASKVLRDNVDAYAELMTKEMGKPLAASKAEIDKCAWVCDYYADHAEEFLSKEIIKTESHESYVRFDPLGIVFAIMPWNFPLWQVFRCLVPSIMAGNVCMLKHASNVPQSALLIETIMKEAGFPDGVFTTLLISAQQAMDVIDQDLVDAVSLTGSNKAGESVGMLSGKRVKEVVLELGGSDPFIVLEDANIERAAKFGVTSRFINNGQSCIAAKRFIVVDSVAERFEQEVVKLVQAMNVGDPMDLATDIGPLAQPRFAKEVKGQLQDAIDKGATVHYATEEHFHDGFVVPAVVTGATQDMRVLSEEVFGPVMPIIRVKDEQEALAVANSSEYGLGGAVWSDDLERAQALAAHVESGTVVVNDMTRSDPRLPFGGIKKSGVGRELSHYGIKEFVNIKTIVVQPGDHDGEAGNTE